MKIKISLICFCILFYATFSFGAGNAAVPSAFVPGISFEHPTVAEGVEITHDFVIQNKGTAPLNIKKVRTG
ncbi:MAG: DUF1573 domain-containing protein [Desulfobacterales bacterium]|nr:DUF1573 domain-containing protein [Desulfobacterales bacterium]